jgi:hypothetical protein
MQQQISGLEAYGVMAINRRRTITGRLVDQTKEINGEVEDTKRRMDGYTKSNAALHATPSKTRSSGYATKTTHRINAVSHRVGKNHKRSSIT